MFHKRIQTTIKGYINKKQNILKEKKITVHPNDILRKTKGIKERKERKGKFL